MASIYGIPTHAVEEYEHESRLGDKESVEQSRYSSDNSSSSSILLAQLKSTSVTSVMGLDPSNLNNYRPLPPPVRAGAAIVRKYRDSEKLRFPDHPMRCEEVDASLEGAIVDLQVTDTDGSGGITNPNESDATAWPFCKTNHDFTLSAQETTKRAAWSWYRSGMLYGRAANELEARGSRQTELGIRELGDGNEKILTSLKKTLRSREERAKTHALILYPQLLQEESLHSASWGEEWSKEDEEYYIEMAANHQRERYAEAVQDYRSAAYIYIHEALNIYLDNKQDKEREVSRASPVSTSQYLTRAMAQAGGLIQLWAEAAEWSFGERVPPESMREMEEQGKIKIGWFRSPQEDFEHWWIRAALSMGHSKWLEEELKRPSGAGRDLASQSASFVDDWRLIPPPLVGHYEEACVVASHQMLLWYRDSTIPLWGHDDKYLTVHNCIQTTLREEDSQRFGAPRFSFLYGPPDSIFSERANSGWASERLGVMERQIGLPTALYERYRRKGVQDFLSESASAYEKLLAICADDIIVQYEHDLALKATFEEVCGDTGRCSQRLGVLASEIGAIMSRRGTMTAAAAQEYGFKEYLGKLIIDYLEEMGFRVIGGPFDGHLALLHIERTINKLLGPYCSLEIRSDHVGCLYVTLMQPKELEHPLEPTVRGPGVPKSLGDWAQYFHAIVLDTRLEGIRKNMKAGIPPSSNDLLLADIFRETLMSGDINRLPEIATGLCQERRRELPLYAFVAQYGFGCNPGCQCEFNARLKRQRDQALSSHQGKLPEEEEALARKFQCFFRELEECEAVVEQEKNMISNSEDGREHEHDKRKPHGKSRWVKSLLLKKGRA